MENKDIVAMIGILSIALVIGLFFGKGCTETEERRIEAITIHALEKGCSVISQQVVCPCK